MTIKFNNEIEINGVISAASGAGNDITLVNFKNETFLNHVNSQPNTLILASDVNVKMTGESISSFLNNGGQVVLKPGASIILVDPLGNDESSVICSGEAPLEVNLDMFADIA